MVEIAKIFIILQYISTPPNVWCQQSTHCTSFCI